MVLRKLDEHTSLECDVLCAHLPHVQARIAAQAAKQEADAATARPRRGVSGSEARMSAALGSAVLGDAASTVEAAARAKRLGDMLETAQLQSALLESALDAKRIERKAVREIDDEGAALGMYYSILRRLVPRSVLVELLTPHVSCLSAALVEGASSSVGADSTKPGSPVSTFREVCALTAARGLRVFVARLTLACWAVGAATPAASAAAREARRIEGQQRRRFSSSRLSRSIRWWHRRRCWCWCWRWDWGALVPTLWQAAGGLRGAADARVHSLQEESGACRRHRCNPIARAPSPCRQTRAWSRYCRWERAVCCPAAAIVIVSHSWGSSATPGSRTGVKGAAEQAEGWGGAPCWDEQATAACSRSWNTARSYWGAQYSHSQWWWHEGSHWDVNVCHRQHQAHSSP